MSVFSDSDLTNHGSFSTDSAVSSNNNNIDQELQDFLMIEKQKAQFNAQIHEFNDFCWEKCISDKPKSKLDGKTETCLNNCVDRFIDVSLFITNRYASYLQKGAKL
ncbi:mitochondrial import inner membrane translocase subunit Tim8, putative [Pediculus humanus corporis]|uniref:Mitochondrial import inner membrane translocase subunit n=1 Tax=Pediculus humanus subsp. corporis TaxID=121224 RepID=E0VHD2_PEDHC|nr:mitochondrial import inner membrane translocase subunit Tim8, putative [Pediculus humanus corporis]EEB12788.1 mitochondrial import inner membrane translocase subunit Tim8, putative [Pediculus humanus corporis]